MQIVSARELQFALLTTVWLTDTLADYSLIATLHSYLHFQGAPLANFRCYFYEFYSHFLFSVSN